MYPQYTAQSGLWSTNYHGTDVCKEARKIKFKAPI
jgi:hypothetical protein